MEHSPDHVRPREVSPKDKAILASIDETLADYDREISDQVLITNALRRSELWLPDWGAQDTE